MARELPSAPWRLGPTTRERTGALLRYLVSAFVLGGAAAYLTHRFTRGALAGFLLGSGLGLFLFRHELRRVFAPTLALGQQSAFLVLGHRGEPVRWEQINKISVVEDRLVVSFDDEAGQPRRWELPEKVLVLPAAALAAILSARLADPEGRSSLPADEELKRRLRLTV